MYQFTSYRRVSQKWHEKMCVSSSYWGPGSSFTGKLVKWSDSGWSQRNGALWGVWLWKTSVCSSTCTTQWWRFYSVLDFTHSLRALSTCCLEGRLRPSNTRMTFTPKFSSMSTNFMQYLTYLHTMGHNKEPLKKDRLTITENNFLYMIVYDFVYLKISHWSVGSPLASFSAQENAPLCSQQYVSTATVWPLYFLTLMGSAASLMNCNNPEIPIFRLLSFDTQIVDLRKN